MFTRANPSGPLNILGNMQQAPPPPGNHFSSNPHPQSFHTNLVDKIEEDLSEKHASHTRVNSTMNLANLKSVDPSVINQGSILQNSTSYRGQPVVTNSTKHVPVNFHLSNQTLTPIRTEGSYLITQNSHKTPFLTNNPNQQQTHYFSRNESLSSTHGISTTPLNHTFLNTSNNGPVRLLTEQKTIRYSSKGDIIQPGTDSDYKIYENIVSGGGNYTSTNPYSFQARPANLSTKLSTNSNIISTKEISGLIQRTNEYGGMINIQGLRKIDPPPELFDSGTKTAPIYVQGQNKFNLNRQIFSTYPSEELAPQANEEVKQINTATRLDFQNIDTNEDNQSVHVQDEQITIDGKVSRENNGNQVGLVSHRSNNSQTNILAQTENSQSNLRSSKTQVQRMSLGNKFVEAQVPETTPIRAALRKQSQPSTINLTFHDTSKQHNDGNNGLELVNTDRKKEWKPLIPENELLSNNQPTGKIVASPINYSSEMTRHITPPPQRNNYQTVSSRPLNKAQNVQSMGRFENNNQVQEVEKVKHLENELAMMKIVVENLQKEKELALKFNQLLLLKLNQVNAVEPGSVVEVL